MYVDESFSSMTLVLKVYEHFVFS